MLFLNKILELNYQVVALTNWVCSLCVLALRAAQEQQQQQQLHLQELQQQQLQHQKELEEQLLGNSLCPDHRPLAPRCVCLLHVINSNVHYIDFSFSLYII